MFVILVVNVLLLVFQLRTQRTVNCNLFPLELVNKMPSSGEIWRTHLISEVLKWLEEMMMRKENDAVNDAKSNSL